MGLLSQVSSQRRKQIVAYAEPHLAEAEDVLHYVRARDPETGRKGFVYLTEARLVVAWKHDGGDAIPLSKIRAWGLNHAGRAPMLRVETSDQSLLIELRTSTRAMTAGVRDFVRTLADRVPARAASIGDDGFASDSHDHVTQEQMSPRRLVKRIAITTLGVALIVVGLVITLLPGPWTILLGIAGLAVLATEYDWAEDALDWARGRYKAARQRLRERQGG